MKVKVSEASSYVLDWLVAKALGEEQHLTFDFSLTHPLVMSGVQAWGPSFIWSQGGPIIEQEDIDIEHDPNGKDVVQGRMWHGGRWLRMYGTKPLVAAMRCFVASRLGDEVEVPKELL